MIPAPSQLTVRRRLFDHVDPHVTDRHHEISHIVRHLAGQGFHGASAVDLRRQRTGRIDRTNPSTAHLLERYPSFGDWLATVPTAAALAPLYDPSALTLPNGRPIDPETREWFCNIADARGIRSRGAALQSLLAELGPDQNRWLSLACGAAQPVIRAAGRRIDPTLLTLLDLDRSALADARSEAARLAPRAQVDARATNVLDPQGFAGRLANDGFDLVEAVGLLEYLKAEDWQYTYTRVIRSRRTLAGAVTFLRHAWSLVRPGGRLIVGNMLDSHPELGFTLNVIQWPHIQPRSIEEMLALFTRAGVRGDLEVVTPDDGVYALYAVTRPAAD